jgi:hypothetical protein
MWMGDICGDETGAQITLALSVVSWCHRAGPNHQMFVLEPCQRRSHLPSWTWAGWDGPVTWRAPPNYEHGAFVSDLIALENLRFLSPHSRSVEAHSATQYVLGGSSREREPDLDRNQGSSCTEVLNTQRSQ